MAAREGQPFSVFTGSYRRAGILVHAAAVLVGRHADHVPEGPRELAGVVIAKLPGDVQHRPVRGPQQLRRAVHLLQAQPRGGTPAE